MKLNKSIVYTLVALIVIAAFYRIIPGRPLGFAPQIAMALFAGAVIKDKKWAFAIPIFSMFLSDLFYQALYTYGYWSIQGFYDGQLLNYGLFALMTVFGFAIKKIRIGSVLSASILAPTAYFVLSNFITWSGLAGGLRGFNRPLNFSGFMMALVDGIPFYKGSLLATLVFSFMLFGGYSLLTRKNAAVKTAAA